jgi:membrane protein YqaA with SNARE-associated domain
MIAVLAAAAVGLLSAFLPFTPAEPYLIAAVATTGASPVALGVAAAAGQTTGKVLIFLAARGAIRSGWLQRRLTRRPSAAPRPPGRSRQPAAPRWPGRPAGSHPPAAPHRHVASNVPAGPGLPAGRGLPVGSGLPAGRGLPVGPGLPAGSGLPAAPSLPAAPRLAGRVGAIAARLKAAGARLVEVLDRPGQATGVLLVSAVTGFPPLLAVSVYLGRTPMRLATFAVTCLLGRAIRFTVVALAPQLAGF